VKYEADINKCKVSARGRSASRTSEQKITSGRSPLYLITFITLLM